MIFSVDNFEPKLKQFQELKLEKTPFIVVSLVGQELLSNSRLDQSLRVLDAARSIGTDSARLKASLLQTLGHAYWQSGNVSQALEYMERNLTVNINNKDERAQCKSHANLGVAYSSLGQFQEALYHHEQQLGYLCADHILAVVQEFLVGGAQCVVIPLWPNSSNSSRHLMNAFYSSLVQGSRTSRGMCYAMQVSN